MKILFIVHPVDRWERLGIMTLSSIVKARGHKVFIHNLDSGSRQECIDRVLALSPDLVGFSAMSTEVGVFLSINRDLKRNLPSQFKTVFGGSHATFFPEMIQEEGVDGICRGEGERAILDYLDFLEGGRPADRVQNFWIRQGGTVIKNRLAPREEDLDSIPFPDRGLWDEIDANSSQKAFFSSRGCPYQCTYCFNSSYNRIYGNPSPVVRRRSVDNFVRELKEVMERYPKVFPFFDDDSFLMADVRWLEKFKEIYLHQVARPFVCNIRVDQVTEKKISLLKEAGLHHCWFGLECGDQGFADRVLKRNLSNQRIMAAADLLHRHEIPFITNSMVALPTDDPLATDMETLKLNARCRPAYAVAHIFMPFPGTRLTAYALEKGLFDGDFARLRDPGCNASPLGFDNSSKRRLERQHKLFALAVAFPFLLALLPLLRRLPLMSLYRGLNSMHRKLIWRLRFVPADKGIRRLKSIFRGNGRPHRRAP